MVVETALLDGPRPARTPDPTQVGMVVWLASELMFFSGLFAAWFTLRGEADVWPPPGVELETARTAAATVVLVASSFTVHLALLAAKREHRAAAVRWLFVTVFMGAVFIANRSIFYVMTGFHGLHVIGGLVFLSIVAGVIGGRSRAPAGHVVDMATYYWHFVDVVWVAMFTVVYLIQ